MHNLFRICSAGILVVLCSACATPPPPPPQSQQLGLSELIGRPAEKALLSGMRLYEDGKYAEAEKALTDSLAAGLAVKKDAALAHKYLAFIYCTSSRVDACKRSFRAARASDPTFSLSKSESGHPLWGPVYRQVLAE